MRRVVGLDRALGQLELHRERKQHHVAEVVRDRGGVLADGLGARAHDHERRRRLAGQDLAIEIGLGDLGDVARALELANQWRCIVRRCPQ